MHILRKCSKKKRLAALNNCKLFFSVCFSLKFTGRAEEIKMKMPLSFAEDSAAARRGEKSGKNGQYNNLFLKKAKITSPQFLIPTGFVIQINLSVCFSLNFTGPFSLRFRRPVYKDCHHDNT